MRLGRVGGGEAEKGKEGERRERRLTVTRITRGTTNITRFNLHLCTIHEEAESVAGLKIKLK